MNYSVDLGCWGSIFAVPTDVVDKHLKIAGSAQLKVLLYILRHSVDTFSESDIASALNMDAFDVKDCIEFWTSFGVIRLNGSVIEPARAESPAPRLIPAQTSPTPAAAYAPPVTVQPPVTATPTVTIAPPATSQPPALATPPETQEPPMPEQETETEDPFAQSEEETPSPAREPEKEPEQAKEQVKTLPTAAMRPLRPDPLYVAKRIKEDPEIAAVLNEAQYIFGRPVSPNENSGIIMLHDNEGLPCEVILMLITYGAENQMGMRQMESMGAIWAKEGVFTVEAADEIIRRMDESKEAYRRVQRIFGLDYRKPSKNEEETFTRWIYEWKFSDDILKEAYDACVDAKGKYIPNYVNKILFNWYNLGIKTVEEAHATRKHGDGSSGSQGSSSNSSFDVNDLSSLGLFNE